MKKRIILSVSIVLIVFFAGCKESSPTNNYTPQNTKSTAEMLKSKTWMQVSLNFGSEGTVIYDAEYDHYFNANLFRFNDDFTLTHWKKSSATPEKYKQEKILSTFRNDTLFGLTNLIDDEYDTMAVSFRGDTLLLSKHLLLGDGNIEKVILSYIPFTQSIPLPIWITGLKADSFEPNNEGAKSFPIQTGTAVEGAFSDSTDDDWYSFKGEKGKTYLFSFRWPTNMDYPSYSVHKGIPKDPFTGSIPLERISDELQKKFPYGRRTFVCDSTTTYHLALISNSLEGYYMITIDQL